MIEVKNLTKVYHTRKRKTVQALNNVSFNLPDQGLVFIVGRSGSGKSTLLNLLGGLDSYDEGDIIINGTSTRDFSQKEMDSFRNSHVGFIFQEYNVLNDLTIEENISIALELQNRKSNHQEVSEILKLVDLENFENRKPMELSTGQKQRVAIARALIKSPKVILADEPTGSLDSVTSKQILDILKNLSKDHLVVVITHDIEFAQEYGDRIIEILDGEIIKDSEKNESIVPFEKQISAYKMHQSKLPIQSILKLGYRTIRTKKKHLFFTVFLATIAFTLLTLTITIASYNRSQFIYDSLKNLNINYISLNKEIDSSSSMMNNDDLTLLNDKFPDNDFHPVLSELQGSIYDSLSNPNFEMGNSLYYDTSINGGIEITPKFLADNNLKLIAGTLPTSDNEIAISLYIYEEYQKFGYKNINDDITCDIQSPKDIIGKSIKLNNKDFIITGIIDTNFSDTRYQDLINKTEEEISVNNVEEMLKEELETNLKYGLHCLVFVQKGYHEKFLQLISSTGVSNKDLIYIDNSNIFTGYENYSDNIGTIYWKDGIEKTELTGDEVLLPLYNTYRINGNPINFNSYEYFDELLNTFADENYPLIKEDFEAVYGPSTADDYANYIKYDTVNQFQNGKDYYYFNDLAIKKALIDFFSNFQDLPLNLNINNLEFNKPIEVVGFYVGNSNSIIVSNQMFSQLLNYQYGYPYIIDELSSNRNQNISMINYSDKNHGNVLYDIHADVTEIINDINPIYIMLSKIFFIVGVVLAFFSSLLLFKFINMSIERKRKDIGVLRALGAKQSDVFKIFMTESLIITLMSFISSAILTSILCFIINFILKHYYKFIIRILPLGITHLTIVFIISLLIAFFSAFIPIYKLSHQKLINIIKLH